MVLQTEIRSLFDCHLVGSDGQSIGQVGQVYLNDRTGQPEWVTVRTGMFGTKETFVPLSGCRRTGNEIHVPFDKERIKDAPNIDVDGRLSVEEEAQLYRHYGIQPPTIPQQRSTSPTGERPVSDTMPRDMPSPSAAAGDTERRDMGDMERMGGMTGTERMGDERMGTERMGMGDERGFDMTASEEQLHIGKETVEAGRVRLRKYIETENVQETVPLSHEEVVIEREPAREGETAAPYEMGEDERTITLHEERAVVGKETRPVEHVHVRKQTVQHDETVSGQVRREHVEVDEDGMVTDKDADMKRGDKRPPL
ncbi:DUF2382 domain-containing protein [Nonomuraea sp. NPDC050783]|uniref:DUF2382 domain-containing protein n=1 Tax=Nonomuraea sp. NPDC050783 TaxID=3154634 RepID=UPI0034653942